MKHENLIRRLVFWNRFWLVLCILTALSWGAQRLIANIHEDTDRLQGHWSGEGLKLFTASSGSIVVTHLLEHGGNWAALPSPIPLTDSGGPLITIEEIKKLQWHDRYNQPIDFPGKNAYVTALYYHARETSEH